MDLSRKPTSYVIVETQDDEIWLGPPPTSSSYGPRGSSVYFDYTVPVGAVLVIPCDAQVNGYDAEGDETFNFRYGGTRARVLHGGDTYRFTLDTNLGGQ